MTKLALLIAALILPASAMAGEWVNPSSQNPRREIAFLTKTGRHALAVEVASTEPTRTAGLSRRDVVPQGTGMLYDFGDDRDVGMWMKDNRVPLDMVFVREDGQVADVRPDNTPGDLTPVKPPIPVRYVVEIPAGAAAAMGVVRLDRVELVPNVAAPKEQPAPAMPPEDEDSPG